ncbi:MAG: hypothetical protein HQL19_05425 [Candidatus Omnitrophica bacterium]|nr:hypothetical protein [Candidatus Omnitrophota bacterium]
MSVWLIAGIALAILGVILVIVYQMPEVIKKQKKEKRVPPPPPPKDWEAIAGRADNRVQTLTVSLQAAQNALKDKDKELAEQKRIFEGLQKQFEQEKVWREKEEALLEKEKKQEKLTQEELNRTREALNIESSQRIRLEYELKEVSQAKDASSGEARKLNSLSLDLDRKVKALDEECRALKAENIQLKYKKEADQWVAKDDYVQLEGFLKRARWETEQFKRKFSVSEWPESLISKKADAEDNK